MYRNNTFQASWAVLSLAGLDLLLQCFWRVHTFWVQALSKIKRQYIKFYVWWGERNIRKFWQGQNFVVYSNRTEPNFVVPQHRKVHAENYSLYRKAKMNKNTVGGVHSVKMCSSDYLIGAIWDFDEITENRVIGKTLRTVEDPQKDETNSRMLMRRVNNCLLYTSRCV